MKYKYSLLDFPIYKDIEGFEGKYQVSNTGKVKSLNYNRTGKAQILSLKSDKDGYLGIGLCKDGKCKPYKVHRLVAQAFISNPNNYPQVMHLDGNPTNNNVNNLAWGTAKMNNNEPIHCERMSKSLLEAMNRPQVKKKLIVNHANFSGSKNPNAKSVLMIDKDTNKPLAVFDCIKEAYNYLGKRSQGNNYINYCCKGKYNQMYGYKWKEINIIKL